MTEIWLPPREAERQRLEQQAERQRRRAPEPIEPEALLHEAWRDRPSREPMYRYRYRRRYWAIRIPWWAWLVAIPLALALLVNPWAFWIGLAAVGFVVGWCA
ncbi:MAG: hypothetical protein J2P50_20760 [Hyphomicrobiaceae bacterium]|nr:hypothetical protein [Hyphomicrobiaceae bacterium]